MKPNISITGNILRSPLLKHLEWGTFFSFKDGDPLEVYVVVAKSQGATIACSLVGSRLGGPVTFHSGAKPVERLALTDADFQSEGN